MKKLKEDQHPQCFTCCLDYFSGNDDAQVVMPIEAGAVHSCSLAFFQMLFSDGHIPGEVFCLLILT